MTNTLIWIGILCCLTALCIQLFPNAAFRLGIDVGASWLVFGFGVFTILVAALAAVPGSQRNRR
ncbi:MAG: hypothetical protein AAFW68_04905 [Pseudomonadota bacterium]